LGAIVLIVVMVVEVSKAKHHARAATIGFITTTLEHGADAAIFSKGEQSGVTLSSRTATAEEIRHFSTLS
jgi:hypothetical protein